MTRIFFALLIAQSLTMGATTMAAQDSTYDSQALRAAGVLGVVEVYRGSGDNLVGRVGSSLRGLDLAKLVKSSPNAVVEAEKFHRNYVKGAIGLSAAIVSLSLANGLRTIPDLNQAIHQTPWAFGALCLVFGVRSMATAYSALSKSIWWYNRDLAESLTSRVQ